MVVRTAAGHRRLLGFIVAWSACACTEPAERAPVLVVIDADQGVRSMIDEVQTLVEVQSPNGGWQRREAPDRFEPMVLGTWPIEFTVYARETDKDLKFQVTATARDVNDAIVGQARAIREFTGGNRLTLQLLLEVECARPKDLCASGQTCSDGTCVDAHYDGRELVRNDDPLSDGADEQSETDQKVAMPGDACPEENVRGCAPAPAQFPVVCTQGSWQEQPQCAEAEMCDSADGQCKPIAPECEARARDVPFCELDEMRVCKTKFRSERRACERNEICKMLDDEASCDCERGFVRGAAGCEEATTCSDDRGGCDPLTECQMVGGRRTCGHCPPGYVGTGLEGCEPLLAGIAPSAGTLDPPFDPNETEYRIEVPLLVQRVDLTPKAAGDAGIKLNGAGLPPSGTWTTPTLPLGEYTVELSLTSPSGSMREYRIVISRAGTQAAYVKASNAAENDHLGISIAVDGDTLVASAMFEDSAAREVNGDPVNNDAPESGAVYVFVRSGDSWQQQAYLKASDSARGDYFGSSVSIHRDTIVVGAVRDNLLDLSSRGAGPGGIYVFSRTGESWTQTARIMSKTGMDADLFGFMSAIENDTIVVGAPRDGGPGAAYVFTRSGNDWPEQQRLTGTNLAAGSMFGSMVGISGDTILVGAPDDDPAGVDKAGSATVFARRAAGWVEEKRLEPSQPADGGSFGSALAIHRDTILIGAPRIESIVTPFTTTPGEVYVYERGASGWQEAQLLRAMIPRSSDSFGSSVALRRDAALIGACGDASGGRGVGADASNRNAPYSGAAYLYAREGQTWRPSVYLKARNTDRDDMFGFGVALSDEFAAVSAIWESSNAQQIGGDDSNNASLRSGALYVFQ